MAGKDYKKLQTTKMERSMKETINEDPLLTSREAAIYIGCRNGSTALLDKLRCYGGGPKFIKIGKSVRYRKSALDTFLKEHERVSTSDKGKSMTAGA